jgi:3'-5' exonuclease
MYPIQNILFLDIETAPQYPDYVTMPGPWQKLWDTKAASLMRFHEGETIESLYPRAGIYAEFGKIICVSCGNMQSGQKPGKFSLKSFYAEDEKTLLREFTDMLVKWTTGNQDQRYLCAHNGKEFDFPYLCRRLVINGIPIPPTLNSAGKKPWEVNHLDTMELWKFGDFKNYTSLNLLAQTLGISTPKDDIDGSMVWQVYWQEKNIQRIVTYCQKDVVTVAQIFLRMNGMPPIPEDNIEIK